VPESASAPPDHILGVDAAKAVADLL
jgi:hypothetical protein